jgi:hypothetical protein
MPPRAAIGATAGSGARRPKRWNRGWRVIALVGPVVLVACADKPLPGKVLGTYKVVGQSQSNSCGLNAPNPWTFDVQLSEGGSTLYWSWMDGTPPLSAPLLDPQQAHLTTSVTLNVDATDAGAGPCTMQRDDAVMVTLASGATPATFTGTITYSFTATTGSDCSDQLVPAGGSYQALPCTITYSVAGSRQ